MADTPSPLYTPNNIQNPAYSLRYTWTGWPTAGSEFSWQPSQHFLSDIGKLWETDGIRCLKFDWAPTQMQITCSVKPTVSPVFFTSRIKGRLQHSFRKITQPVQFSRKVAFRSIGENSRNEVEGYVAKQVSKEKFLDSRFSEMIGRYTVSNPQVRLQEPLATCSGRYWYNLHLVIVTESRARFTDETSISKLSRLCDVIATKKYHRVSTRAIMPDHIHIALGGNIEQSPEDVALSYMNNTAYGFGQKWIWRPSYYVGSFGEYDMGAVRRE